MANPYQGEDVDPFSGARDEEGNIKREEKKMSFKDAFAAARKSGDKTFTFNGKKYTTEMAGEKRTASTKPSTTETKPASMTGKEVADEKRRLEGRAGKSRLGESAFGRLLQRGMDKGKTVESSPGDFNKMMEERRRDTSRSGSSDSADIVGAKKGGMMGYKKGGSVSSASKRADGCAVKGKTRGRMV